MIKPLISVIVPIYKVEKYLDKCINSIINQTYRNLEIILIDDGSPDNCPQICDEWAKKDSRIIVIHKENGGLSNARNTGLNIANGEYISFVDSDDSINKKMFEILIETALQENSDIVACNWIKISENQEVLKEDSKSECVCNYSSDKAMYELINNGKIQQVVWNKIYKKSLIKNIKFEEGKIHEDEYWTYKVIGCSKKITLVEFDGYYYLQRDTSIMGNKFSLNRLDAIDAKIQRQKFLNQFYPKLSKYGKIDLLFSCLYYGQKAFMLTNLKDKQIILDYVKLISKKYKLKLSEYSGMKISHKIWLFFSSFIFRIICKLRNCLRIGI